MNTTLPIEKKNAIKAYKNADDKNKKVLEDLFGKENLITKDILQQIEGFLDCLCFVGETIDNLPFKTPKNNREKATNAFWMMDIITESYLDGTFIDWANSNQKKWSEWLDNYSSGSGFRLNGPGCAWALTNALGGARLFLDSKEKVLDRIKKFPQVIQDLNNPIR